jgi:hypothetical protein
MAIAIADALITIEQRGSGLLHFVNQYRNLAHVTDPKFSLVTGRLSANALKL